MVRNESVLLMILLNKTLGVIHVLHPSRYNHIPIEWKAVLNHENNFEILTFISLIIIYLI